MNVIDYTELEGNEDSEKYILQDEAVTVSAAPKYNVQLKRNTYLAKEYELLRRKFYKAYDIDKIERLVKTSKDIEKLKNDNKLLEKLNEEIRKCREEYEKNLGNYIENQIVSEIHEETEETTVVEETEEDEEPEIRR